MALARRPVRSKETRATDNGWTLPEFPAIRTSTHAAAYVRERCPRSSASRVAICVELYPLLTMELSAGGQVNAG
jgi:hypothetical protein